MKKPTEKEITNYLTYRANHVALVQKLGKLAFNLDFSNHDMDKINATGTELENLVLRQVYRNNDSSLNEEDKNILRKTSAKHALNSKHHFEYWDHTITTRNFKSDDSNIVHATRMPDRYIKEAACDWAACSLKHNEAIFTWYNKVIDKTLFLTDRQKNFLKDCLKQVEKVIVKNNINYPGLKYDAEQVEPLKESKEDNFKKWFGNSKIVDKEGNPEIMYHETNWNMEETGDYIFDLNKTECGCFFFKNYPSKEGLEYGDFTYKVYLKVENPRIIERDNYPFKHEFMKQGEEDGVIWIDTTPGSTKKVVSVFLPNQIKSVDNNGDFSTESNNIYESLKLEEADRSRFINPNPNLTPEQKEELISLFKKFTTLGGNIKWGSKEVNNWTYEQFLPYIQASKQSKNQSFKTGLEGLVQGEDYEVIGKYDDGTISYAIFDYKASVVIASNQVEPQVFTPLPHWAFTDEVKDLKVFPFGKPENPSCDLDRSVNPPRVVKEFAERDTIFPGAKWCTAMQTSDEHWNEYTQHKIRLAYICSPSQEEMKWKKTALVKYDRNTSWGDDVELYDSFDNSHASEEYPNQQVIEDIISWMKNHKTPKQDLVKSGFLVLDEKTGLYNNTVEKHINDMWDQLFDYDENGNRTARYKIGTWKGTWSCKDNTCKDSPRVVQGRFMASMLTSLEGCPYIVGGDFDITASMLNNLVGGPVAVSGNYYCTRCHLKSLDGAPLTTSHTFDCSDNDLITLEGAPKQVGGGFFCENNKNLKSLKGCPESIDSNLLLRGCKNLESIEGIAHRVGGFIDLSDCKKIKNRTLPENCKAKEGVYWPWTDEEISDTMDDITKMSDEEIHNLLKTNESKIKESEEQIHTPQFKAWFGDWQNNPNRSSKVVDKNGKPLIVYHGSNSNFDEFDSNKIGKMTGNYGFFGKGFYFTDDINVAKEYYANPYLKACYLNIRNPFKWTSEDLLKLQNICHWDENGESYQAYVNKKDIETLPKLAKDIINHKNKFKNKYFFTQTEVDDLTKQIGKNIFYVVSIEDSGLDLFDEGRDTNLMNLLQDELIKLGYDGCVGYFDGEEWVAFYSNQIKSATDNNGDFNPESKKITESEDITQSENFKKWFKNSKIVDKNGNPLLVYHGTPKGKFDVFKNRDNLFYFTDKKEHAEWMGNWTDNDDVTVYSCYLSIQNPKIIDVDENWWGDIYGDSEDFEDGTSTRDFAMAAKYEGYDGAIIYNVFEGGDGEVLTNTYVAFSSNQIKSIDNNGNFDSESENIYEKILKKGNKWQVTDHTGKKNLGTYDTKAEAEKRLRQVEYFKNQEKLDKPMEIMGMTSADHNQIKNFADLIHDHGLEHHDLPGHECWSGLKEKAGDIYIVTDMTGRRIQNTESDDVNKVKEIRNFLAKKYNEIFKIMKLSSQTENIELSEYKLTEDGECSGCVGGGESVSSGCNFSSNFTGFAPEKVSKKVILNSNLSDFDTEAKKVLKESILDIPHKEYCKNVLTEDDRLQPEVRKQIVNTVKKWKKQINFNFKVTGLYAKGSLLTKRYNDDTDLDVSIYTNMTQEQLDEIYDIIPKGQNITGTNHPLDFYVLIDGEETNEKNLDNIYDVAKDKWIKRTEEYSNELPLEYVMQTCNFFINGCVIALNNYENDKILYNYYKNLSSENYELSNDELIEILSDKKKDLLSDLDGLRMATHMISAFRQEAYDDEPIPFGVSIEVLNDNVHVTLNEQLAKLLEKFAIRDKLRDAIKECETLLGLDKEEGTI